ncbi:MAG: hypothetical protein QOG50_87 [Actinomycetota bacterium]|jgi:hypothetical protein|nr:hypothetical protein [Actinomycetota bacterium]
MRRRALVLVALLIAVFLCVTAGAASGVGQLTVSNPAPTPGSTITVASTGWSAGHEVTIALSGAERTLARVAADARGAVHARVIVPSDVTLDFNTLSVTGTALSGVPQQIVTALTVRRIGPAPAPSRPWTAVLILVAIAAALLLVSITVMKPVAPHRLAQS